MKSLLTSIIILVSLICTLVATYVLLNQSAQKNASILKNVYTLVQTENWQAAEEEAEKATALFEKSQMLLSCLVDHLEIDAIEQQLISIEEFIKTHNKPPALESIARTIFLFTHIETKNRLNIENIL